MVLWIIFYQRLLRNLPHVFDFYDNYINLPPRGPHHVMMSPFIFYYAAALHKKKILGVRVTVFRQMVSCVSNLKLNLPNVFIELKV